MNKAYAVQTEKLIKAFDKKEIIKNCSINVEKAEIYGFLGVNGAGKTTVFKILAGLLTPTMGKVWVLGMDMALQRKRILEKIGTLIDTPIFYEHLSAEENLRIHLAYMGKKEEKLTEALEEVGLYNTQNQPVSTFSLGMRQRLAIARAVVHKPELLILDEPVNGLDPVGMKDMRDFFLGLVKNHGMTILISSHILTEMEHIADKVGVIADGTVVREVSMNEIKKQYPSGLEDYFMDILTAGRKAEGNTLLSS